MKEKIKQLLIRISYDYRRQKKVEAYTKMKEKYSSMSKEEFSTEYVQKQNTNIKKMMLTVVVISFVISTTMNLWGYLYDTMLRVVSNDTVHGEEFTNAAVILVVIAMIVIFLIVVWIVFDISRNVYRLNKKKLYLEEIRLTR